MTISYFNEVEMDRRFPIITPLTDGGPGQLRTDGEGADNCPRDIENEASFPKMLISLIARFSHAHDS